LTSECNPDELIGLIPSAGKGLRMRPLTDSMPKSLIKIQGKTLLERAIEDLKIIGVEKIIIVTVYLKEKVRDFIGNHDFGIPIEFVDQKKQKGLAHTIAVSSNHLNHNFVLFCPDNIYTDINDLKQAKKLFFEYSPKVLQPVTVTPTQQKSRSIFLTGKLRNLAPNLFDNAKVGLGGGMPMYSTGITFFSIDALDYLPDFNGLKKEHEFPDFLYEIFAKKPFLVYLMKGKRYDFSEPKDIDDYVRLKTSLESPEKEGVSSILISKDRKLLLHLRDDKPTIPYPGVWALFGGSVNKNENSYEAIKREIKEEINFDLVNFGLFREFVHNKKREYAFVGEIDKDLEALTLKEGQEMRFFEPNKINDLEIRPDDKKTLEMYIKDAFL